ncbi:hypothetical protein [Rheinheimera texasensis]|uniref:hypothetical protein n=1 Tax=Rheinheimera texasensis TaxID=306205 RepID=UPI00068F2379|nr:hypothetical protein [Rheinheimera texasensis]
MKLQLVIRRAPAKAALEWLKQGWLLMRAQLQLLLMFWLMLSVSLLGMVHPLLAVVSTLLNPFLMAGFYDGIVRAQQQKPLTLSTLWQPLKDSQHRAAFIRLAALNILFSIPSQLLIQQQLPLWQAGQADLLALFALVALAAINAMLFAYAVPVIYFLREQRLWPVLQASFMACWRNVPALTVYGVLSVLLVCTGPFTMMISLILVLPWLAISFFLSFREFFVLTPARPDEAAVFEV